jgi:antirestriction protein ArdC
MNTEKTDIYQEVTDRIIASLEAGKAPWLKPWKDGKAGSVNEPHNAVTGRRYNGINWLILNCMPYASSGWLTYKQAVELGGNVRKGEKGVHIVFWQFNKRKDEKTGETKTIPFAKGYTVFNVEQCENLDPAKVKAPEPAVPGATSINALAASAGAIVQHGGNRAYYSSARDFIAMPSASDFKSIDHYQSTLAHELTHWTGHEKRCKRDFSGRFGNAAYAFEELVAEMGSAFICAQYGIALDGLQHAEYIGSWLETLKGDKRAIFTAASKAKEAVGFLTAEREEEALAA